ncbi:MAG: hypothetical protein ACREK6_08710 [Candidatus Rokuibacteriota bacterium]
MHTDVWYDLVLLELTGDSPVDERIREAEAVQMPPPAEPEAAEPAGTNGEQASPR